MQWWRLDRRAEADHTGSSYTSLVAPIIYLLFSCLSALCFFLSILVSFLFCSSFLSTSSNKSFPGHTVPILFALNLSFELATRICLLFPPLPFCQYIMSPFSRISPFADLYLGNVKFIESSKHKQFGVVFKNITFDNHISQHCKKVMSRLTTLKRV